MIVDVIDVEAGRREGDHEGRFAEQRQLRNRPHSLANGCGRREDLLGDLEVAALAEADHRRPRGCDQAA